MHTTSRTNSGCRLFDGAKSVDLEISRRWIPSADRPSQSQAPAPDTSSFVARKISDPQTLDLLLQATERALDAVQQLIEDATVHPEAQRFTQEQYVDLIFGYEVAFLFPCLAPKEQALLVSLLKVRNTMGVHLSGLAMWRTPEEQAEHHRTTRLLESEFARISEAIEAAGLQDRMDHLQRRVLRDEFQSVLLDKPTATQLFFRRGRLPALRESDPPAGSNANAAESGTSQRILLLHSQPGEANGIACWLGAAGYETVVGKVTLDGCRLALQLQPDLILMDYRSVSGDNPCDRILDSRTILQVVANLFPGRNLPVIGLVHPSDLQAESQLTLAQAKACLRRPLDPHRLLAEVESVLGASASSGSSRPTALTT